MEHKAALLSLPIGIVGPTEVGRLGREIAILDEFLSQAAIRQPGSVTELPRTSRLLEVTAEQNNLNLLVDGERRQLMSFIEEVMTKAPVLHISLAADPSPAFLNRLIAWLRAEIHPLVLVQIGLQPSVAAGCTMRTTNKYFDFSLRKRFTKMREDLINRIGAPG